jgi:hydrogenase maturation protease
MQLSMPNPTAKDLPGGSKTLVLGVGNILRGDDGLGVRAVQMLQARELPASVCVEDAGTPGVGLVTRMEGWERVVIIDAAYTGQKPGMWRRYGAEDVKLVASGEALSLHESDIACALALAQAVNLLPPEVVIYGVEPQRVGWGEELSPVVQAALPALVDDIMADLWKREG